MVVYAGVAARHVKAPVVAVASSAPTQRRRSQNRLSVAPPLTAAAPAAPAASTSSAFEEGADVVGTVVWAGPKGAKVLLPDDSVGFMPSREAPYVIRDANEDRISDGGRNQGPCVPKGLVRTFKVINVPGKDAKGKTQTGPLLSARLCDLDVLWQRAEQLCELSTQHKENLRVTVEGANNGGLLSRLNGLSLFVPVSQLEKRGGKEWWTEQDMAQQFAGQEVNLAVVEVARSSRKVVCSVAKAKENDELRQLEVGQLVTGTVRRIEPFGVFVGIDNTRVSGLLHISNVSRQHIESVQGVFKVGEQVKCLVMGLDPGYTNISLSVAELELEEGDILTNKQRVWDNAGEQAALFRAHLEQLREEGFDFEKEYEMQAAGGAHN
ncbi:hypothetical protein ABPG77_000973 [Micractinium sp. CCAP 211/92]